MNDYLKLYEQIIMANVINLKLMLFDRLKTVYSQYLWIFFFKRKPNHRCRTFYNEIIRRFYYFKKVGNINVSIRRQLSLTTA